MCCIQIQIQFQNIDAGLAQETELACLSVIRHECADVGFAHATLASDPGDLESGGFRRNVRIET
jgi:hypothetical protein